jgi:hypothetical protein
MQNSESARTFSVKCLCYWSQDLATHKTNDQLINSNVGASCIRKHRLPQPSSSRVTYIRKHFDGAAHLFLFFLFTSFLSNKEILEEERTPQISSRISWKIQFDSEHPPTCFPFFGWDIKHFSQDQKLFWISKVTFRKITCKPSLGEAIRKQNSYKIVNHIKWPKKN